MIEWMNEWIKWFTKYVYNKDILKLPLSLRVVVGTIVGDDVGLLLGENEPFWWPIEWFLLTDDVGVVVLVVVISSDDVGEEEVVLELLSLLSELSEGLIEGCWSFISMREPKN